MTKPFGISPKALLRDRTGRILVLQRSSKSSFWPGQWDFVGGKIDPGETFDQALIREAREEAGLDIELTGFTGAVEHELPRVRVIFLIMEARVIGGELELSHEHEAHRWVSDEELMKMDLAGPLAAALRSAPRWNS
ncbi:MAG: NUDIX domain-containing protein [bacterium]